MLKNKENLDIYFSGKKLYGNNFNLKKIKEWFSDEKEGYSGLVDLRENIYGHHEMNNMHGFSKLNNIKKFKRVLSFGGATGDELFPIINKIDKIYIVEPSKKLRVKKIQDKLVKYISPKPHGKLDFKDNSFDLITCFGVLHHVPNVSLVFKELVRILRSGGFLLIREPIVSMGDWRKPRKGLTKRERGIPENIFEDLIKKENLKIISKRKILFPLLRRIEFRRYRGGNSKFWVYLDYLLSESFSWNKIYHSTKFYNKLRPQSVFYVLRKI